MEVAIEVGHDERTGQSCARTTQSFSQGETIASFDMTKTMDKATRTSVQVSHGLHVELLGSPLAFMNHSCEPSVFIDVTRGCVIALRALAVGDQLTFFYPSTEWAMASPFDCKCGAANCLGRIEGASLMPTLTLAGRKLAPHIVEHCFR